MALNCLQWFCFIAGKITVVCRAVSLDSSPTYSAEVQGSADEVEESAAAMF
jgi:hypothetical protein